jgi:NAD-dependent SIR2 family protein deacetylase
MDCDLFIVVGSSWWFIPLRICRDRREYGARLVIINQGETPLMIQPHFCFRENWSCAASGGRKIESPDSAG